MTPFFGGSSTASRYTSRQSSDQHLLHRLRGMDIAKEWIQLYRLRLMVTKSEGNMTGDDEKKLLILSRKLREIKKS
ncbi:hypothetical protein LguiA_000781 [Lonicera macranthoides]